MNEGNPTRLHILLAEDDSDDQMLLAEGFEGAGLDVDWRIVENGEAALDFLAAHAGKRDSLDILVLDLNMPRVDGLQVLETIHADAIWQTLPVVVLSTSSRREEAERSKALGALDVLSKPVTIEEYKALALKILELYKSAIEAMP